MSESVSSRDQTIVKHKIFLPWQDEAEERWLESQAKEGLLLKKVGWARYEFVQANPQDWAYRLDYANTKKKDLEEYKQLFADAGWEHVTQYNSWQYFRIPSSEYTTDIYTDNTSKIEKYNRVLGFLFAVWLPVLVFPFIYGMNNQFYSTVQNPVAIGFITFALALCGVCSVLYAVSVGLVLLRIKRLKDEMASS